MMNINWQFEQVEVTSSTNTDLLDRLRLGEITQPISRMALVQTSGKGRRGRKWISEPRRSLTFSLAYPFNHPDGIKHLSGLSLACGMALIHGLSRFYGVSDATLFDKGLRLKWPNDVLINNEKVAGVLIEGSQNSKNGVAWMVIGIGINLYPLEKIDADYRSSSLDELIPLPLNHTNEDLWRGLSASLWENCCHFNIHGFKDLKESWNKWHAFQGKVVEIKENSQTQVRGTCIGVTENGALMIDTDSGIQTIYSGDVSLRLMNE